MTKTKNIIIGGLLIAIIVMSVGYAVLAQNLEINAVSNITGNWNVEFTNITEGTMLGATTKNTPSYTATSASFEVDLAYPGASANYDITVKNSGNIDAVLDSIVGVDNANSAEPLDIQYTVTGVEVNDELLAGKTATVHVNVTWKADSTAIPELKTKTATITLNYVQKTS